MTGRLAKAGIAALCCGAGIGGLAMAVAAAVPSAQARHPPAGAAPAIGQSAISLRATSPTPLLAYYYIWFNHSSWNRAKKDYPLIGTYSSGDSSVMRHQIQQAKAVGIDGFIVSWKNTELNDQRLRTLMTVASQEHFKLAMIYQGLDFYRRPLPVATVAGDFAMFRAKFAASPVFFRLGGKPLTIWSGTWAYTHSQVAQVTDAVRPSMLVLSTEKSAAGYQRIADVTDGDAYYWSSVNPATNTHYGSKLDQMSSAVHHDGKYWIAPFAPGFDARQVGGREFVPRDGGQTLRSEYDTAVRSSPDVLGLISWNEFSENSYVEPSVHYGYQSLGVLHQLRGTAVPQPTGPAAPSETGATHPRVKAPSEWPNVLRLAGFPIALVIAVGFLGYTRRRAARSQPARPLHRRSSHRNNTRNNTL
jgi:Glycosyl hydrolase family 71